MAVAEWKQSKEGIAMHYTEVKQVRSACGIGVMKVHCKRKVDMNSQCSLLSKDKNRMKEKKQLSLLNDVRGVDP